jgi:aminocarboxymuconate-semialdehyde decarboxylase
VIVDVHAHVIVPAITRAADPADGWRPDVRRQAGAHVVGLGGRTIRSALGEFVDAQRILDEAAAAGVDRLVLSPWVNLLPYELDLAAAVRACRVQNDALAGLCAAHPDRVAALGAVPLQDPPTAVGELEALMAAPGMGGAEVAASVAGVPLGDDRFLPFWEAAEDLGAVILVHPTTRGFDLPALERYYLWNTVGNPLETAVAGAHLVMAGALERFPRLRLVLAHGGGALAAVRGRLRKAHSFQPQARERLAESPDASLRRLYYDTVTHDADLLRALVDWAGADHVLLGSDRPFDMGADDPVGEVRALGLDPAAERAVLGGTAAALLGLEEAVGP